MERISDKSPCLNCCSDRQIGNPYAWQSDCYRCQKLPNWKAKVIDRLAAIEDILGDDYDIDRLKELLQADRDGRCVVLPCRVGDTLYYIGGTYKTLIKPATVEEVYIGDGVFAVGVSSGFTTFTLQEKEWYKSKKEAEAALERMEGEEK